MTVDPLTTTKIRITTRTGAGLVTLEFCNAQWCVDDDWLLVTHDAADVPGARMLSRLPLINLVQIQELVPAVAS